MLYAPHPFAALTGDAPADLVSCRTLARQQVAAGAYGAILAPSAARADAVSLTIFHHRTDHVRALANGLDPITIALGDERVPGPMSERSRDRTHLRLGRGAPAPKVGT